jgi:hypothetical protein
MRLPHGIRAIAVALALIVAACAAGEQTAERDGSSIEQAIVLEGVTNEIDGVRAEHAETARRFPGWQWESQGLLSPANGRHYDVITLSKGGETKTIYFDITDWFGKFE